MISNFGFERKIFKSVPVEQVTFSSQDGFHFVTYHRGDETYGLIFDLGSFGAAMSRICSWASNPQLLFNWYDTSIVAQAMRIYRKKMLDENCSGSKDSGEEHLA